MLPKNQTVAISPPLEEILAVNLLRACPSHADNMGLSPEDKKHLCEFRRAIGQCSRQNMRLSSSRMHRITCHERCLLNTLAALQAGHEDVASQSLEWLVYSWAIPSAQKICEKVAEILLKQDIKLLYQSKKAPVRRQQASLYAVIG